MITAIWHTNMSIQDTKKIDALACERAMVEESQLPDNRQGIIEVRKRREMTRKDILKKHGFSWTSNVNLKEELSEQAVPEFLTKRMNLPVRREEETGWKKQMYNKFMKGAGR